MARWKKIQRSYSENVVDEVSKFVIEKALAVMPPETAKKFMSQIKAQVDNKKLISSIQRQNSEV